MDYLTEVVTSIILKRMKSYKQIRNELIVWSILYIMVWSVLIPVFFITLSNEIEMEKFEWDTNHIITFAIWLWMVGTTTYQIVSLIIKTVRAKKNEQHS